MKTKAPKAKPKQAPRSSSVPKQAGKQVPKSRPLAPSPHWIARYEKFDEALAREVLAVRIGKKQDANTAAIVRSYEDLYDDRQLAAARSAWQRAMPGTDEHEIAHRIYFAISSLHLYKEFAPLNDKLSTESAKASVAWKGKRLPYYGIPAAMEVAATHADREKLDALRLGVVKKLQPIRVELNRGAEKGLRKLGFKGQLDYYQSRKRFDYDGFLRVLTAAVRKTDTLYRKNMAAWVNEELGLDFAKRPNKCHTSVLHRFGAYVGAFKNADFNEVARKRFAAMGMPLYQTPSIHLDTDDRPTKNPRASMISVKVPQEVYLIIKPKGTYDDYSAFFHEAGHALHYGLTGAGLHMAYRHLGTSYALSEIYSFLVQNTTVDAKWFRDSFGFRPDAAKDLERKLVLFDLYMFRRYVAKFTVELHALRALQNGGLTAKAEGKFYADTLTAMTGFTYDPRDYLNDRDAGLYSADYLRAWVGERQLVRALRQRFGDWTRNKKSGPFLAKLWKQGDRPEAEEIVTAVGQKPWDTSPLLDWHTEKLGR